MGRLGVGALGLSGFRAFGQTLLSQIWPLVSFGFAAQGLRANLGESDLAPWWVLDLRLEVKEQTLQSQIWSLGGFWLGGLGFIKGKP